MPLNPVNRRCGWRLVLGLTLVSTGFAAEEAAVPDDTLDLLEFLGSPEADSELWNSIVDSVPDQPDETGSVSVEAQATMGADE
jgi:hypothetical protein